MEDKKKNKSRAKELYDELKSYLTLESDYLQIVLVEKTTKILSLFVIVLLAVAFSLGFFFFLLFALAYFLMPLVGDVASFAIVGGVFLLAIFILAIFRNALVVNPLLRILVHIMGKDKNGKEVSDEYNEEIG